MLLRLLLALAAGGAVGYGRSRKERPAGLRTYMIISVGAAMSVLLGCFQYEMIKGPWAEIAAQVGQKYDASRLAAQVITGIGFLGAGIIIKAAHQQVKGLTTASGLFATVCMGIAAGVGFYEIVLLVLVLLAETWFAVLGGRIQQTPQYTLEILYNEKNSLDNVLRFCKDNRMTIVNLRILAMEDPGEAKYTAEVALRGSVPCDSLLASVRLMAGVVSAVGL